jgi:hypothetical protein
MELGEKRRGFLAVLGRQRKNFDDDVHPVGSHESNRSTLVFLKKTIWFICENGDQHSMN